jgi:hypothetical protein
MALPTLPRFFTGAIVALACCTAFAQSAPGAAARPVLEITGKVASAPVQLDMAALQRLPQQSFKTNTPWTREPHTYSGPLLRDVLALAGAQGAVTIKAIALNDYQISIPAEDAAKLGVIVAHQIDGKAIPVRERGPLFVIYPFDSASELRSTRYYERSIWQLKSMRIE